MKILAETKILKIELLCIVDLLNKDHFFLDRVMLLIPITNDNDEVRS